MSRNSSPNLVFRTGSTALSLHPAVPILPDHVETRPLFQTFPPKFLRGAGRSKFEEKSLPIRRVSRSSVSMSNRRLIGTDPVLEFPRSAINCCVHAGRVLDNRVKTSGSG